jgi:nucleotide-binding universal stress UspA family protein
MIRRIIHPTDFSSASGAAFAKALELAKANRARLFVVHVLAPIVPMVGDGYISPTVYSQVEASTRGWATKLLDRLLAKAKRAGVRAQGYLLEGVPHEAILKSARARRADLIVLGTHGRTGLAKLFLGSVAGRVAAGARSPVLTVRGR